MNKIISVLFILLLFSCTEKKTKPETTKIKELTEIAFEENSHDFGFLNSGEIVVYSFVFENTGKSDLIIENAEADCGCIHAEFPKEPIKPGEKGKIDVEFDSSGMFGKHLKSIEIQSNCKETKHLVIFAEIKNEQIEIKY